MAELKQIGIPIIEDCAHTFFSDDKNKLIGTIGDFVIYSFPKMFPIQIGGLLKVNKELKFENGPILSNDLSQYVKKVLSKYISEKDSIIQRG